MKSRLAASAPRLGAVVALGLATLLGTTGCTFLTHQASTISYSASDGVNIGAESGPLAVRNVMIVADENGEVGNLVAGIVNDTDRSETLTITVESLPPLTVDVEAGKLVSLGANDEPLRIDDLNVKPGATVKVFFQSGDGTGESADVPVLDGALPYYSDLVPGPAPKPSATVTP
ncbi:MAG: DNA modification methylase [Microbacterium sp.]